MPSPANPPTIGRIFGLCLAFSSLVLLTAVVLALPISAGQAESKPESRGSLVVAPVPVQNTQPVAQGLLPGRKIVAYYGNFYPTKIGALAEHPEDTWTKADPSSPAISAIHYMAVTDGWGNPQMKTDVYRTIVADELPQFSGFKIFYKRDLKLPPHKLLSPEDLSKLKPTPLYIQYQ